MRRDCDRVRVRYLPVRARRVVAADEPLQLSEMSSGFDGGGYSVRLVQVESTESAIRQARISRIRSSNATVPRLGGQPADEICDRDIVPVQLLSAASRFLLQIPV